MEQINSIAWFLVLIFVGFAVIGKLEQWWAARRLRQIRDEVVKMAREIGIEESHLTCPHGVLVGDECRICHTV